MAPPFAIRRLDPDSHDEREWVAARMRRTLEEVLGEDRGRAMYSLDWLRARLRHHLEPGGYTAAVFLAVDPAGARLGQTIVREDELDGAPIGLISTTWVEPAARRQSVAQTLLEAAERWIREQGLGVASTCTSSTNVALVALYEKNGYAIVERADGMVRLSRELTGGQPRAPVR